MTYKLECLNPIMRGDIATNELATAIGDACAKNLSVVTYTDGEIYALSAIDEFNYNVIRVEEAEPMCIFTDYSFNMAEAGSNISAELKAAALLNLASEEAFTVDGTSYHVDKESGELFTADGTLVALMSDVRVVDSNAQDTFDVAFKEGLGELMSQMRDENQKAATLTWSLKQRNITKNEEGKEVFEDKLDEEGNPIFMDEELQITELIGTYTITRNMPFYVTNKYAPMSAEHPFGTDGNGMDIFARMMYGGRISLLVGFVVVILSMLIGVILGGIAGYFGGWVDTLIMRLVEIFYCIPSYPILIILGGYMDAARMDAISRLYVMMAVLGILSWAGIARLVRGQILSLREQEFMIATESTGVKVRHRIFRHLVPNVMPQLIVSATGSLGGVILTESSLSFLGLGVKFPLATWGNMIEFVTGLNENLGRYIYIWLPVGLLICFTVISFNFVGDGLRDAFDPKMKR
ncbi:MAG: ABC transporter permease [Ruminococcaceae bacterium]|nr:ABC transporter permease [Oscillospiraceae bacterium]